MVLDLKLKECRKQKVIYVSKESANSSEATKEEKEEEREEAGKEGIQFFSMLPRLMQSY